MTEEARKEAMKEGRSPAYDGRHEPDPDEAAARVEAAHDAGVVVNTWTVDDPDRIGAIALRAGWPSMFRTYLDQPERYRACFVDGWYCSGDLARRDAEWMRPVYEALGLRVGMKKRIIAMAIATVASSINSAWGSSRDHPGMVSRPSTRSFRKTQPKAVAANKYLQASVPDSAMGSAKRAVPAPKLAAPP